MLQKTVNSREMEFDNEQGKEKARIEPVHDTNNSDLIESGYSYANSCLFCKESDDDDMNHRDHSTYVKCNKFGVYVNCSAICHRFEEY